MKPRDIRKARNDLLEAPTENIDINGKSVPRWEGGGKRSPRKKSPKTVVHYLNALSVVFSYAIEQDWIPHNPVREVKKPRVNNARQRFPSPDAFVFPGDDAPRCWSDLNEAKKAAVPETAYELPRYLAACRRQHKHVSYHPEWLYNISVLRIATGMRPGEAEGLEWSRVHLHAEAPHLILVDTKNGQPLNVPLFGEALRILKQMHAVRRLDAEYVFPRKDGLKPLCFRSRYARAFRDAGLKDFKRHDLRHTAASYLAMRGASAKEVADILNQRSTAMAERYMHLSPGHTRTRVQDMNKAFLHNSLFSPPRDEPTPTDGGSAVRVLRKAG
ncbi:MAG: site-specific integrase [Alphaproteobacteria bacterium]